MKIVRYKTDMEPQYGIVEDEQLFPCFGDPFTGLTKQKKALDLRSVKLLSPVSPPNIVCVGLNYRKHAEEAGVNLPSKPLIFLKATTSICGPGDSIVLPFHDSEKIDYEVELAIVIGKELKV